MLKLHHAILVVRCKINMHYMFVDYFASKYSIVAPGHAS